MIAMPCHPSREESEYYERMTHGKKYNLSITSEELMELRKETLVGILDILLSPEAMGELPKYLSDWLHPKDKVKKDD